MGIPVEDPANGAAIMDSAKLVSIPLTRFQAATFGYCVLVLRANVLVHLFFSSQVVAWLNVT